MEIVMKLATVGDNCMDVYEELHQAFPGGNPVNVAVYFTRLGGEASYTGVVGNDTYGKKILEALRRKGIDTSFVRVLEGRTAITQVTLVNGERVFGDYDEGVLAGFSLSRQDIDFLSSHDLVVSGIWGMIDGYVPEIRSRGVPFAFDFATKLDDPIVDRIIDSVDYAFFSYPEDDDFIRGYMEEKQKREGGLIVVTLGENGSIAFDGKAYTVYGIVPCEVIDSMGAGDSYIAGFLKGILEKRTIEECMHMGASNSSVTIGYMGAW